MSGNHYTSPFNGVYAVDAPNACAWCAGPLLPWRGGIVRPTVRVHAKCAEAYWADQRERADACERETLPLIRTRIVINYDVFDDDEDECDEQKQDVVHVGRLRRLQRAERFSTRHLAGRGWPERDVHRRGLRTGGRRAGVVVATHCRSDSKSSSGQTDFV